MVRLNNRVDQSKLLSCSSMQLPSRNGNVLFSQVIEDGERILHCNRARQEPYFKSTPSDNHAHSPHRQSGCPSALRHSNTSPSLVVSVRSRCGCGGGSPARMMCRSPGEPGSRRGFSPCRYPRHGLLESPALSRGRNSLWCFSVVWIRLKRLAFSLFHRTRRVGRRHWRSPGETH